MSNSTAREADHGRPISIPGRISTLLLTALLALALRATPALADMVLLRRGSRLSVQPVSPGEWKQIVKLGARA